MKPGPCFYRIYIHRDIGGVISTLHFKLLHEATPKDIAKRAWFLIHEKFRENRQVFSSDEKPNFWYMSLDMKESVVKYESHCGKFSYSIRKVEENVL